MPDTRQPPVLGDYRLLGHPADAEVAALVRVAAQVTGVPTATLNLIDATTQHQLATVGFVGADCARAESMCAVRFEGGALVHVPDASAEPDYRTNPWVDGTLGAIRAYASAPLVTGAGVALGTLCVFDTVCRRFAPAQLDGLRDLAAVVVALLERRREAHRNELVATQAEEQRMLLEITLREAESRQEFTDAVLETIDVAVIAGDPGGHLTLFNRASRDLHGRDADPKLDPTRFSEYYGLHDTEGGLLPTSEIPLLRALHDGKVEAHEIHVVPEGRPATVAVCSGRALTSQDGTVLGAVVAMTDVTADRRQRRALEDAHHQLTRRGLELAEAVAELERSNSDLEHFAAIASHDLHSPLAVVSGYLELLSETYADQLEPEARTWIDTARRGAGRMDTLISSLLGYAKAGGGSCRREPADTGDLFAQVRTDLYADIVAAGAEVTAGPLPEVYCDPTQVRQVLQNLVSNALKHPHPDRPLRVRCTSEMTGEDAVFTVADNGTGIPAEERQRVFGMFTMVEPGAQRGHGIGLATCQRIIERHGGRISADETPGGGATLRFTLRQRS